MVKEGVCAMAGTSMVFAKEQNPWQNNPERAPKFTPTV